MNGELIAIIVLGAVVLILAVVVVRLCRMIGAMRLSTNGWEFGEAMGHAPKITKKQGEPTVTARRRPGM